MENNKSGIEPVNIALGGFVADIILLIVAFPIAGIGNAFLFYSWLILLIIATSVIVVGCIGIKVQNINEENRVVENMNQFQCEYDDYLEKLGIVKCDTQVTLIDKNQYDFESHIPQYLWITDGSFNMFPMSKYYKENQTSASCKPDVSILKLISISVDSILYFEEVGELRKHTKVSGGGTSLKGALVGYAIAGDIGALIGSRSSIETEIVSEDDRRIELIYKNQDENICNLEFTHDAYHVLKKLIPSKEFRRIIRSNMSQEANESNNLDNQDFENVKKRLKQLNELQNEGLISEEEFLERKNDILNSL